MICSVVGDHIGDIGDWAINGCEVGRRGYEDDAAMDMVNDELVVNTSPETELWRFVHYDPVTYQMSMPVSR